jgi:bla regulator protein BlaR1
MTLHWVLYLLTVSIFLSCAGVLVELWARPRFRPIRTIWLLTLIGSLALPAIVSVVPHRYTEPTYGSEQADSGNSKSQVVSQAGRWISLEGVYVPHATPATWDRWVAAAWVSTSIATFSWVVGTMALMAHRRRSWRTGLLAGNEVLWSVDFGPAVVGVLRPSVVIPTWVQRLPESRQRLILSHERSHLEARDPLALTLGMIAVALAPWNPLLWWQLRRLRLAIEVDCDRRLLAAGAEPTDYASALLDCSLQRMTLFAVNAAMAEPASTLERRIAFMHANQTKGWTVPAVFALLVAAASAFAATQVPPPPDAPGSGATLQAYVGNYGFPVVTILNVAVRGEHLVAAFASASPEELVESGRDEFRFKSVDARLSFSRNTSGQVTSLIMRQNGADTLAPKLDAAQVKAVHRTIESRIRSHQPAPGSEKVLRGLIDGLRSGAPDYSIMNAQMAGGTRVMLQEFHKALEGLGGIRTVEFKGVNGDGWDQYVVQHDRGQSSWRIVVDEHGVIVGALWHEGA